MSISKPTRVTRMITTSLFAAFTISLAGCSADLKLDASQKEASVFTREINQGVYNLLDFSDEREREFAEKNLLAAPEALEILDKDGNVIWSQKAYAFTENTASPDSANPSLWRNTQLNHAYGLFEVMDGIYQVRGYDISNVTFIRGDTGWIVFDPLSNVETASAALNLINETLGERPVAAVIISHTHADHFGGIKGVVSEEDVASGKVPVIVPEGFEEHAVSENMYAGNAMQRRADYMYGRSLEPGVFGRLSVGLGIGMPGGISSYIPPTDMITQTGEVRVIDGVKMEFQLTPSTEAPAEMNTWFPDMKALWMAENCTGTLHNLYTLRGAQVRDGSAWAKYIMETAALYGGEAQVTFQSHNWPHFGNGVILEYLENNAAVYKFINDQTLLYLNQGYTSAEIAGMIKLPEALEKVWYTRQYYGTLSHNAKAVYQKFMGWYDANPAHLNPLPLTESAYKFVEYMGSAKDVLKKAKKDFDKGEYRWVAEITMILVYADPGNKDARLLCADALEQLGYQAESGVWRAAYLTGAKELRESAPNAGVSASRGGDMLRSMSPEMIFDYMGIHIDSNAAQNLNLKINFNITDDYNYIVTVKSGVLLWQKGVSADSADATVTVPKQAIALLLAPEQDVNGVIKVDGDPEILAKLTAHMAEIDPIFNIIEP